MNSLGSGTNFNCNKVIRGGVLQRNSKVARRRVNLDEHVRPRRCCRMTTCINLEFRV